MPAKRILVVDDDAAIRRLVTAILKREHYEVHAASGGREALSMIERVEYDVVVLDLMMEEVSGLDVLRSLESRAAYIKRVVILSAAPGDVATVMNSTVFAALGKPFDVGVLIDTVARCIEAPCSPATQVA